MQVVAALLVRDGRVLAARRARPAGWEFPGGKVDPGESPEAAIARECREELGVMVQVEARLAIGADAQIVLQLWRVELVDGEPVDRDHEELRWVGAGELDTLAWLPVDRALLGVVRTMLGTVHK